MSALVPALSLLIACAAPVFAVSATEPATSGDSNWTFTYLKATNNHKDALRQFVEANWFAMDAIAVDRGLFKSYRLIENITEADDSAVKDWDFIVAVEYFGDQTYLDIREPFEQIRSEHETVLIGGKAFRDLGKVVRSERVRLH